MLERMWEFLEPFCHRLECTISAEIEEEGEEFCEEEEEVSNSKRVHYSDNDRGTVTMAIAQSPWQQSKGYNNQKGI